MGQVLRELAHGTPQTLAGWGGAGCAHGGHGNDLAGRLSGWFITATALARLLPATALVFDAFMPSAGIRLLAVGATGARYAERLVTHDATLAVLARCAANFFAAGLDHGPHACYATPSTTAAAPDRRR